MITDLNKLILERFTFRDHGKIILVKISRIINHLPSSFIERFHEGRSTERMHQLACAASLIQNEYTDEVQIIRNEKGAPRLVGSSDHISISHTGDYMAIYLDKQNPVAIDIELQGRDIRSISRRFALDKEVEALQSAASPEPLLHLWGIKECLFKVIRRENVLFKEHLLLDSSRQANQLWHHDCHVAHPEVSASYSVVSRIFGPLIISYTV